MPTTALVHASRPQAIREMGVQSEVEVFVLKDGKASLRKVPLIALVSSNMVIASGLNEGEQVVTTGAAYLSEGRAAKIVPLVAQ